MKAFCYRSGHIHFGRSAPEGTLELLSGPAKFVRERIEARARHGWDNDLLVPGIPEAVNDEQAETAYIRFRDWVNNSPRSQQVVS